MCLHFEISNRVNSKADPNKKSVNPFKKVLIGLQENFSVYFNPNQSFCLPDSSLFESYIFDTLFLAYDAGR